jgi:hypothetical protein
MFPSSALPKMIVFMCICLLTIHCAVPPLLCLENNELLSFPGTSMSAIPDSGSSDSLYDFLQRIDLNSLSIEEKKVFGAKILLMTSVFVTVYSVIQMKQEWNRCDRFEDLSSRSDSYGRALEYYNQARKHYQKGRDHRSAAFGGLIACIAVRFLMTRAGF